MNWCVNKFFFPLIFVVFIVLLVSCDCKTDNYQCPEYTSEVNTMIESIHRSNFIFVSDSGKRILLKTKDYRPEKETTQVCTGTRKNCNCAPCNGSDYFEIHAIDTSGAAQFWHITFLHSYDPNTQSDQGSFYIETVTFQTSVNYPFVAGDNVQNLGDLTLNGKIYKDVYRVEIKDKNSVTDLAFVMINTTHGIVGFKELDHEEIFYRL